MYDLDILDFLITFIELKSRVIKKKVLWVLANFCSESQYHCKLLTEHSDLLRKVFELARGNDIEIKREALLVIFNISDSKAMSVAIDLTQFGILGLLSNIFTTVVDTETLNIALEILVNMFLSVAQITKMRGVNTMARKYEELGGLSHLESLLNHHNNKIYEKVDNIIKTYYKQNYI
jgi:hypothetical protein